MTTAPPPAHYGAVKGALASGFATAELHHLWGHDQALQQRVSQVVALSENMSNALAMWALDAVF